jgi:ApaG protein
MNPLSKSGKTVEEKLANLSSTVFSQPYEATTNSVEITVWPEFIDSKFSAIGDLFIWAYHVKISNKSHDPIKLVSRYWRIIDEKGVVQEVNGEGVIGEQPVIAPNCSYQYSSGVHLRYPSGIMNGKYQMQKVAIDDSGKEELFDLFEVQIPTFSLDVPTVKPVIN